MKAALRILLLASIIGATCSPNGEAKMHEIPRSEHPNPQMLRSQWLNLNGTWEFAETDESQDNLYLSNQPYPDKIIVPFCRESELSGLGRKGFVKNVWYRRTFELPENWNSPRTRVHIGACDWRTRVWLNGHLLGAHVGGSVAFAFEATQYMKPGKNTLVVHAFDDTRSGAQALGKQSAREESYGCLYTRTTGIWQTVWLEGVGASYLRDFQIQPDPAHSRILIQTEVDGSCEGLLVKASAYAGKKLVGSAETPANWRNGQLVLELSEKHLWSVKNPFLYDLKLTLEKGGKVVDQVDSYFGLRDVSIHGAAILINGEPVFQRLVLDQGFYPDGIWTAPSEAALRKDIELSMAAGFNGARLHQKVFEPRFLYLADKMGYLVWGEFPNWGLNHDNPASTLPVIDEWNEIVRRDRNHPAIIGWCPFNETPKSAVPIQNTVVALTRTLDPSRPVIDTSGWSHGLPDAEVLDAHDYDQNPESFRARWGEPVAHMLPARYGASDHGFGRVPFFVSEYGGIGWNTQDGWGYGNNPKTLDEFYTRYKGLADGLLGSRFMFGFCYTQLTDVEQEKNGIYTYQREPKFDLAKIHAATSGAAAYEKNPPLQTVGDDPNSWKVLIGAVPDIASGAEWRYITEKPADGWNSAEFDDAAWKLGKAGFGKKGGWEWATHTTWEGDDIWLRRELTCDSPQIAQAMLVIHFDDDTEVFVNGEKIWSQQGWSDHYQGAVVTDALKKALKPGRNVVAVHCGQRNGGGQFIDLALLVK